MVYLPPWYPFGTSVCISRAAGERTRGFETLDGGLQGLDVRPAEGAIPPSAFPTALFPGMGKARARRGSVCLVGALEVCSDRKRGFILATDLTLTCRDCGREFLFTVGEQEFYASRGLMHQPARCPECRSARKASMSGGYSGERPQRQFYTATCSSCGREARVPFQPRGDKPVYCSECYQQMGSGARTTSGGGYSSNW